MKIVGLIPARGGSKGIVNKNIRLVNNKPLIAYTIEAVNASQRLSELIVSTDSEKIANIAKDYGASAPFLRPSEFAEDSSNDLDVIKHLLSWQQQMSLSQADVIVYLRPTTPLKTAKMIDTAIELLCNDPVATGLRSVSMVNAKAHPYWSYRCENKYLQPFIDNVDINKYYQRQKLPPCYCLNGLVDIVKTPTVFSTDTLYGDTILPYIIDPHYQLDIDSMVDLHYFEFLIKNNLVPQPIIQEGVHSE